MKPANLTENGLMRAARRGFSLNSVKALFLFCLITFSANLVFGQCPTTYNYRTSGSNKTWATQTWAAAGGVVTTGGAPPSSWGPQSFTWSYDGQTYSNAIVIPAGVVVDIEDPNFYMGDGVNLVIQGTLVVNGKLDIESGQAIIIDNGGTVCCNPTCNASDRITVGGNGNPVWGGSTGNFSPVSGPASSTGGPLPIVLSSFEAEADEASVNLKWSTAAEINFHYFNVQRSADGKNFETLGIIKGHGTTTVTHDYSYVDQFPLAGTSYYRLQTIDFDGYSENVKVIAVIRGKEKQIALYPNPVLDKRLYITLNFVPKSNVQIVVSDLYGHAVLETSLPLNSVETEVPLEVSPGFYSVRISSAEISKVTQIFVK
ncbi:MAG TPA: T9SS type A sorting domain-containing protein [Chryseosolibacter sp.]